MTFLGITVYQWHFDVLQFTMTSSRITVYQWHFDVIQFTNDTLTYYSLPMTFLRITVYNDIFTYYSLPMTFWTYSAELWFPVDSMYAAISVTCKRIFNIAFVWRLQHLSDRKRNATCLTQSYAQILCAILFRRRSVHGGSWTRNLEVSILKDFTA